MSTSDELEKAKKQFDLYWKPVENLSRSAKTRQEVKQACEDAKEQTGMNYCFGIGYYGKPMQDESEKIAFHGWLYDDEKDMISVWYTHGSTE